MKQPRSNGASWRMLGEHRMIIYFHARGVHSSFLRRNFSWISGSASRGTQLSAVRDRILLSKRIYRGDDDLDAQKLLCPAHNTERFLFKPRLGALKLPWVTPKKLKPLKLKITSTTYRSHRQQIKQNKFTYNHHSSKSSFTLHRLAKPSRDINSP